MLKQPPMRKPVNHYIPLDTTDPFSHRSHPAFIASEKLQKTIARVIDAQAVPNELDELQEPLADLILEIIEISAGGMSLVGWRRRYENAMKMCQLARHALPPLVRANAMSAAESLEIAHGIDAVAGALTDQLLALCPPEAEHEAQAEE